MNANAAYQVPVQQRRRRISRQEMLREEAGDPQEENA